MGGATYTKEDVLGKGLYNKGADTLTYVDSRTSLAGAVGPISADFNAHATAGPKALDDVESRGAHEKACLEFPNGREEYLS